MAKKPEELKTKGQIAYEAYCKSTDNKSLVSGEELPSFSDLKAEIKTAWENAAKAVFYFCGNYVADHEVFPTFVEFENGRTVQVKHVDAQLYLEVGNK